MKKKNNLGVLTQLNRPKYFSGLIYTSKPFGGGIIYLLIKEN
jgi:hypothetical protein